jgi:hypothetical protein
MAGIQEINENERRVEEGENLHLSGDGIEEAVAVPGETIR